MPDIKGYRDLSSNDITTVNIIKNMEIEVGNLWRDVTAGDIDKRWAAVAKTHFQEGFMALVRSVTKPEDVF
jgi:hypothetical protein